MKKRNSKSKETLGPTNRQLRAGENIRHVLVNIIARGEIHDPALQGISITIGEVRMSPDLLAHITQGQWVDVCAQAS